MRSLIRELPYEQPLVAGVYRYQRGDAPTGVVERWRLSVAPEGYRFLRVDLNAEASAEAHSTLYHLVLNAQSEPERLSFRDFRRGRELKGTVLFEGPYVTLTRQLAGERREVTLEQPAETRFWFPGSAALGLIAAPSSGPGLTLNRSDDFNLWPTHLEVSDGAPATLTVSGRPVATRRLRLSWAGERRVIWCDAEAWPLKVERGEVVALETRRMIYQRRPGHEVVSDIGDDHGI